METTDLVERLLLRAREFERATDFGGKMMDDARNRLEAAQSALQARVEKLRCLICENEASQCPTCEAAARNELTALVERLREGVWGKNPLSGSMPASQAMLKAADTITALQARVSMLEGALTDARNNILSLLGGFRDEIDAALAEGERG